MHKWYHNGICSNSQCVHLWTCFKKNLSIYKIKNIRIQSFLHLIIIKNHKDIIEMINLDSLFMVSWNENGQNWQNVEPQPSSFTCHTIQLQQVPLSQHNNIADFYYHLHPNQSPSHKVLRLALFMEQNLRFALVWAGLGW